MQESSAVVANLLAAPDTLGRQGVMVVLPPGMYMKDRFGIR